MLWDERAKDHGTGGNDSDGCTFPNVRMEIADFDLPFERRSHWYADGTGLDACFGSKVMFIYLCRILIKICWYSLSPIRLIFKGGGRRPYIADALKNDMEMVILLEPEYSEHMGSILFTDGYQIEEGTSFLEKRKKKVFLLNYF